MRIEDIAVTAAKALDAKKGKDIVVLRVDEMTVITDYIVSPCICANQQRCCHQHD